MSTRFCSAIALVVSYGVGLSSGSRSLAKNDASVSNWELRDILEEEESLYDPNIETRKSESEGVFVLRSMLRKHTSESENIDAILDAIINMLNLKQRSSTGVALTCEEGALFLWLVTKWRFDAQLEAYKKSSRDERILEMHQLLHCEGTAVQDVTCTALRRFGERCLEMSGRRLKEERFELFIDYVKEHLDASATPTSSPRSDASFHFLATVPTASKTDAGAGAGAGEGGRMGGLHSRTIEGTDGIQRLMTGLNQSLIRLHSNRSVEERTPLNSEEARTYVSQLMQGRVSSQTSDDNGGLARQSHFYEFCTEEGRVVHNADKLKTKCAVAASLGVCPGSLSTASNPMRTFCYDERPSARCCCREFDLKRTGVFINKVKYASRRCGRGAWGRMY